MSWELVLMSDLVKVGTHPEDGEDIIRELWYVAAESELGRRFRHAEMTTQAAAEERLALLVADGGVDPLRSQGWIEMYPVYGSLWYQGSGEEQKVLAAEIQDDLTTPVPDWIRRAIAAQRRGEVRR